MSTVTIPYRPQAVPPPPPAHGRNYLNAAYGWQTWLFTTDHKRIAILYMVSVTVTFFLGGLAITMTLTGIQTLFIGLLADLIDQRMKL